MELIEFIQKLFLLILPGIIGMLIIESLNINREEHYYLKFIKTFALSFFAFLIPDLILKFLKIHFKFEYETIDIIRHISTNDFSIKTSNEILAIICAIFLALIITKMKYNNTVFKIANKLKITRRVDNQSVWEHLFDTDAIVVIRDGVTSNTYYGKVEKFSDNSENRELLLSSVKVFDEEGDWLYDCESLYLSRMHNEFSIEIFDYVDNIEKRKFNNE